MGGGGKSTTQTSSNRLDPQTYKQVGKVYDAADKYGSAPGIGVDQTTLDAIANDKQYAGYGNLGLMALNGDPTAMAKFTTPGGEDILKQMDVNAAQASQAATNATNQSATRAGAFGGSRAAVAQGTAQAGVQAANMKQKADFQYQQNQAARQAAMAAMGIGQGANQALGQYGQYLRSVNVENDPAYKKFMALKASVSGTPYGSTTSNTQTTPWGSVIGGGLLAGGSMFL